MASENTKNPKGTLRKILKVLRSSHTFFLSGHRNPDPDTVGSELALRSFILRLGARKRVDIYNADPLPKNLRFLAGASSIKTAQRIDKNYDCAVIMECSSPDRMGNIIDLKKQARHVINIDHHLFNSKYGNINLIDPQASSNAEQVFHLMELSGRGITPKEATALYAGLVTDTGRFQYSNTKPQSHEVAGKLLAHGANVTQVCQKIYMEKPLPALRLLGHSLSHLKLLDHDRIALMILPQKIFRDHGAAPEDTEDIVNHGLLVPSVRASVLLRPSEKAGQVKVSLRSKGSVDVNRVARFFGGGGHKKASGCTLTGTLEGAARVLISRLKSAVR